MRRDGFAALLVAGGLLALAPAASLLLLAEQHVELTSDFHFWSVGVAALAATAAGVGLSLGGRRRQDVRAVVFGTAFTVMAALLLVHAFASPGVVVGRNGVVALTGAATLPVGGAILALGSLPALRERRSVRAMLWLQGLLMAATAALGALALASPGLVPSVPAPTSPAAVALLVAALAVFGLVGLRALRTVLLARRRADLLVLVGVAWLAASVVPALLSDYRYVTWWLGHGLEVAGILLVGAPVALDLFRARPSRPLAGDLRGAELVFAEESYLGGQVSALTRLLARKDASTEGHTRRVALLAVQVGEELGLPASRLRNLAIGGLLHDIGKLSVPDEILKKPGPLEEQELEVVRRHPLWGDTLLGDLGFSRRIRRIVRDHHERLDGNGYPRGAAGDEVCSDTRILAVCDVYDALLSERVYRSPWTPEQALELLRAEAGRAFDARAVAALERVLARQAPQLAAAV